jgi:hypothetical protein
VHLGNTSNIPTFNHWCQSAEFVCGASGDALFRVGVGDFGNANPSSGGPNEVKNHGIRVIDLGPATY